MIFIFKKHDCILFNSKLTSFDLFLLVIIENYDNLTWIKMKQNTTSIRIKLNRDKLKNGLQ